MTTEPGHNGLTVDDVCKNYPGPHGPVPVLCHVGFTVARGESVAIVGPSGSGKSTLLNIVGSLDRPDSGAVSVGNLDVTALTGDRLALFRREVAGFVFQDHLLLPQCTVRENILLPRMDRTRESDPLWSVDVLLARVGLGEREHAFPDELSGGEKQRVALARALANEPLLLLCDEPTGNLDQKTGATITDLLLKLVDERKMILVFVTHNLSLATRMNRVLTLENGTLAGQPCRSL